MRSATILPRGDACFENLQALDRELASVARRSGALRFAIGLGLDALARSGGYGKLGFTSIDDYGQERCELGSTAIRRARRLARRSSELPRLRAALFSGRISWSMATELAAVATTENEAHLFELAAHSTVGAMRDLLKAERAKAIAPDDETLAEPERDSLCPLTITEDHEDALLFECAHTLARHLGANTMSEVVDALVAEASTSLFPLLSKDFTDPNDLAPRPDAQNAYIRQRDEWRKEAERLCESRIPSWPANDGVEPTDIPMDFTGTPERIDASIRQICAQLQQRDVTIGDLADRLWKADGWRRLGYATDAQYARERLGMSVSSINEKRKLARELPRLPHLRRVFRQCHIGYEAARLVASIATPATDAAWADRAVHRTIQEPGKDQKCATATLAALETAFRNARHTPRHLKSLGRDTLRLRVEPEIRAAYRGLERLFERHRPLAMTFLRFACQALIDTHAHELPKVAYSHIYARDGLRCMNPFCTRRDCTPHHVRFRVHGGDDSDDNVITLCTRCHLEGVHAGRFTVRREGASLVWRFGTHTVIVDRDRFRAA